MTATNVGGEERSFVDHWGERLYAREYRARFRFRVQGDFEPDRLAVAARASAGFPVAFPPLWVSDADHRALARLSEPRWLIDGGLLDNAPIAAALDLIPRRVAAKEVKRFVCYLNADPPQRPVPPDGPGASPTVRDVLGYVVSLPRQARFVDQVDAVEEASRRGYQKRDVDHGLLEADLRSLVRTANALLPGYAEGQRRLALEGILGDAREAEATLSGFGVGGDDYAMPSLSRPFTAERWRWGLGAAQRTLHLLVDLLRDPDPGDLRSGSHEGLLSARLTVFAEIDQLTEFARLLDRGEGLPAGVGGDVFTGTLAFERVNAAIQAVIAVRDHLGTLASGQDLAACAVRPRAQGSPGSPGGSLPPAGAGHRGHPRRGGAGRRAGQRSAAVVRPAHAVRTVPDPLQPAVHRLVALTHRTRS